MNLQFIHVRCFACLQRPAELPTCLHQKSQTLSLKSQVEVFEAYTHKTCTTTHKIDIKTRQKHRYNTSPYFGSIFFPRNYTVVHLFLINNIDHF